LAVLKANDKPRATSASVLSRGNSDWSQLLGAFRASGAVLECFFCSQVGGVEKFGRGFLSTVCVPFAVENLQFGFFGHVEFLIDVISALHHVSAQIRETSFCVDRAGPCPSGLALQVDRKLANCSRIPQRRLLIQSSYVSELPAVSTQRGKIGERQAVCNHPESDLVSAPAPVSTSACEPLPSRDAHFITYTVHGNSTTTVSAPRPGQVKFLSPMLSLPTYPLLRSPFRRGDSSQVHAMTCSVNLRNPLVTSQ